MNDLTVLRRLVVSIDSFVVFDGILQDKAVNSFIELLDSLTARQFDCRQLYKNYHNFVKNISGQVWRIYLIECVIHHFNTKMPSVSVHTLDETDLLSKQKQNGSRELGIIQKLAELTPQKMIRLVIERMNDELNPEDKELFSDHLWPDQWPVWQCRSILSGLGKDNKNTLTAELWLKAQRLQFIDEFSSEKDWGNNYNRLVKYFKKAGNAFFSSYAAFKLDDNGKLEGLTNLDPVRISNLICQEREQRIVVHNTESLLNEYPSNNIILYGNRGTGKSSLVKALLNEYAPKGLRLVQLKKNQVNYFPDLVRELTHIPLKFIIFIDDLSFDDVEEDYKNMKTLLEGGVEARPHNIVVYATSNRKHLVRETFADRRIDDVHGQDSMEEKLSLADRFGITVTFLSPDQETYLKIVEGLAVQTGINIDKDELRQKALKWVVMHNGRSGRTARQFIDHLRGELGVR